MKKNKSLQILVPFIANKIEKNYDVVEVNGAAKKNLYLMVIDSLNNNKYVNLEYHVEEDNNLETHPLQDPVVLHHFPNYHRPKTPC